MENPIKMDDFWGYHELDSTNCFIIKDIKGHVEKKKEHCHIVGSFKNYMILTNNQDYSGALTC